MARSKGTDTDKDEKELEKLAKKLLSTPHKPRDDLKVGKRRKFERGKKGGKRAG